MPESVDEGQAMNEVLFRRVSVERLSSPEQLDQLLRVTDPKSWLGLFAIGILLITTVIWGFKGSIVTTAAGQGVVVRSGGVLNVVSHGAGTVLNLNVHVGDRVNANQVVATVAQPALVEKRDATRAALAEAVREREHALEVHQNVGKMQIEALVRQRANAERQIKELQDQAALTNEQIASEEQLLAKGLVTKQQALAIKQKLIGIQDDIATRNAQLKELDAQKFKLEMQPDQEDADMRFRISVMQRDLVGLEKELSMAENVVSSYPGQILELKVSAGTNVQAGQAIISLQPDAQNLELLAYVPSSQAKNAREGMEVQISPSTVKREEFGFMKGKIVYVSDYPATTAALMRNFENELLVSSLTGAGPVTEMRIALERDARTPTGFQWSTSLGPSTNITSGTICSVLVVTRRQRPIALVLPYMKSRMGLE
jgi:HlyD family secretion protein